MDILTAIQERRSIRKYSNKPVEDEKLNKVLEAFRLAPSARNNQMWKFIIVKDESTKEKLVEAAYGQEALKEAPIILVACGLAPGVMTNGHRSDTIDLSIAMSFVILEAYEQGLGTCWMARYDENKIKAILGIPEGGSVVMISPLGYGNESPDSRPRKSIDEVVSYDSF